MSDPHELELIRNLTVRVASVREALEVVKTDLTSNDNAFFMCSMGLIIFMMQCGFAFLEAGSVRAKNCTNILTKNVLDSLITIVGYWSIGWALAYGDNESALSPIVGGSQFFGFGVTDYARFFFQYVFAARASTIISGAVAERCEFFTFFTYSIVISSTVYPILTHWGWSKQGWLNHGIAVAGERTTYLDFAGSGVVHLCGGTISLLAAYMLGPRIGRFENDKTRTVNEIQGHSAPFAALGGFVLMFGFLAFNGGSAADISTPGIGQVVAKAMINTIMCGAFAAVIYIVIYYVRNGKWTMLLTINACLAGMIASCAGCNIMRPWTTTFTGMGAGLTYLALSELVVRLRIDDPLDSFAVHAGGGLWGLIAVCVVGERGIIFSLTDGSLFLHAIAQLGWNIISALSIVVWSTVTMIPVFIFLKKIGKFRVPREVEIKGLDIFKHGEAAYPLAAYGHGWEESDHQDALPISKEDPAGVHARNGNDIALTQRHPGQAQRGA
ncbi:Protein AMT-4 [Aphelenchoides avenae]|nr:Protein AMT-4 [Aphelenchus avenae]